MHNQFFYLGRRICLFALIVFCFIRGLFGVRVTWLKCLVLYWIEFLFEMAGAILKMAEVL